MKPAPYGPFAYSPIIRRPRLTWPGDAHVALWVIPNIEFFSLMEKVPAGSGGPGTPVPDIPSWSARDYGNRVGVFRLMQVLDRHGIRATVALNSDVCAQHPEIIEEGRKLGWEWMGHCESNTRRLNEAPPGEEKAIIGRTLATIAQTTGARPAGWLGSGLQETWDTLELLAAEGCEYVCDWTNDDQPYVMKLFGGGRLISLPYSHEINDKPVFERFHRTADEFCNAIRCALPRGRAIGSRHGHRATPLSHRRTASHRRLRRGARLHLQSRAGMESDGCRDRATLSRADRQAVTEYK